MCSKMSRFWRGLGKVAFWGIAAIIAYVVFSNVEKETVFWIGAFVIILGFNYEIQTIKEKLDAIQWMLDDMRTGNRTSLTILASKMLANWCASRFVLV